jgi:hypothetical protein
MSLSTFNTFGVNIKSTKQKYTYVEYYITVGENIFQSAADVSTLEILLIGGGGGGGFDTGGGGGGGGFVYLKQLSIEQNTIYTITVGDGGLADTNAGAPNGGNGEDSTFGSLAVAHGGGGGGDARVDVALLIGGSGGGGQAAYGTVADPTTQVTYASTTPGAAYTGEGNAGGSGSLDSAYSYGGGGGGAGLVGQTATSTGNAKGGDGSQSTISNMSTYYSGGGGGGTHTSGTAQSGGLGGGGYGSNNTTSSAIADGSDNTGGGGGGGGLSGARTGKGGSGIVIIKYSSSVLQYQKIINGTFEFPILDKTVTAYTVISGTVASGNTVSLPGWSISYYLATIAINRAGSPIYPTSSTNLPTTPYYDKTLSIALNTSAGNYGSISQKILLVPGTHTLSFYAAGRKGGYYNIINVFSVKLNGTILVDSQTVSNANWTQYSYQYTNTNTVYANLVFNCFKTDTTTTGIGSTILFANIAIT